ncbi:MAG: phosphotransferase, partial [Sulfurimonas sp.]
MIREFLAKTAFREWELKELSGDASFRKYYRLSSGDKSAILMDSSSELDSLKAFLKVHKKLECAGVCVSKIYAKDESLGFLVHEDFGTTHYLDVLNGANFMALYEKAIDVIVQMQQASASDLPLYDKAFLHKEMDLMEEWYIKGLLKKELSSEQQNTIKASLEAISKVVLAQPQSFFVHRDFHSRNIMLKSDGSLGVIDFQDAMNGAITYDLVSLLKDCYIAFDRVRIEKLVLSFRDKLLPYVDDDTMIKWFDFMGLQRHIKVLGVFSRLYLRDKKDGYLKDIPQTLEYVLD